MQTKCVLQLGDMLTNVSKNIYKLKFFKKIDSFAEIKGGKSGAKTFFVTSEGNKYFVKFRSWKTNRIKYNNNLFEQFATIPKLYKYGKVNGIQYFISSYIGDSAKHIEKLANWDLYNIGKQVATQQIAISNSQKLTKAKQQRVYKRFYKETSNIYKTAISLYNKNCSKLDNDIKVFYGNLITDIKQTGFDYLKLFETEKVIYTHSDFKTDNFFMVDNQLFTVDFEESYFGYLPFYLRSYAYEILCNNAKHSKTWYFIKGVIDTFYDTIPDNFSKLFMAVYYRAVCQKFIKYINKNKTKKLTLMASNILNNEVIVNKPREMFDFEEVMNKTNTIIFVTGKSGCGKSTIAKMIAEKLKYKYIDVDKIGHAIYKDKTLLNKVTDLFGTDILENGVLNRKLLGAKLFTEQDKSKIDLFNEITGSVIQDEIEKHFDDNVVVDWVLLPKTRFWNIKATKILVKSVDEELRYAKIIERDNISKEYLKNRENSGVIHNEAEYDYVIVNDYDMQNLNAKAEEICNNLKDN